MIETIPFDQICIPVTERSQPAAARRAAVALAHDADLDEPTVDHLALVVTELATNLVKHARGGELLLRTETGLERLIQADEIRLLPS